MSRTFSSRSTFSFLIALSILAGCSANSSSQSATQGSASVGEMGGQMFAGEGDYAGSHILVAYTGASNANPEITRTKEEALEKAMGLIEQLNADPTIFEELAKTESDGPSGVAGGSLGSWEKGRMVPEFDEAVEGMEVGSITDAPVETAFGYHVIRRNPLVVPHYGVEAFIVGFAGPQSPPDVERTRDEAKVIADEIAGKLSAATFDELAAAHNDFAEGPMFLGGFKDGDREAIPGMLDLAKSLAIGDAGGPIEFPVGFAFIRHANLDQRSGAHILIAYTGALRASAEVTRSKEEALAEATSLISQLQAAPDEFAAFALEHSDGPSGPTGGDLGVWFRGQMVPEFDEAIDDLDVSEISAAPVETEFGYHIIQRRPIPE